MTVHRWKSQKDGFQDSLIYLKGRKDGIIKSIKTPWSTFNGATTDGIEWHSLTLIAGRSGVGKTSIKDQLIREAFILNPGDNFRVLEFSFEMLARVSAIREYSSHVGRSYKYLCSAQGELSDEDLRRCYEYAKLRVKYPIDVVEEPCPVEEFKEIIMDYMDHHSTKTINDKGTEVIKYTNTIITLDHSLLMKKKATEDPTRMLSNLGEVLTWLKRRYPIAFVILSQLNRNIEEPKRNENRKYGNYVVGSDIMGSDALLQHADTVVGLNRPGVQKIDCYGPRGYIIHDDKIIAMHFIKCRNGDSQISFFKADFDKQTIMEIATPAETNRN
jgi:replicative DNA helicase